MELVNPALTASSIPVLNREKIFTSSGTFTPDKTGNYLVYCYGGGGGGGAGAGAWASVAKGCPGGTGGGSGRLGMGLFALTAGTSYTITVGVGGAGAARRTFDHAVRRYHRIAAHRIPLGLPRGVRYEGFLGRRRGYRGLVSPAFHGAQDRRPVEPPQRRPLRHRHGGDAGARGEEPAVRYPWGGAIAGTECRVRRSAAHPPNLRRGRSYCRAGRSYGDVRRRGPARARAR